MRKRERKKERKCVYERERERKGGRAGVCERERELAIHVTRATRP